MIDVAAEKVLEFKMEISHIVTVGCSYTYCQGLSDPTTQGWPALLADKLYTSVVNLGLPGVGNDNIHRRTYEYFYKNLSVGEGVPLFVIAWTQPWRREAWFKHIKVHYKPEFDDYHIVSLPDDRPQNSHEQSLLDNWNEEDFVRKTLLYKLSLINLFENHGIPYVMANYSIQWETEELKERITKKFPELVKTTENKNVAYDLHELVHDLPKLPCGHDDVDAQKIVASYLAQKIRDLYPNDIFVTNKPYFKLQDFIKGHKYSEKYPEWCKYKSKYDTL